MVFTKGVRRPRGRAVSEIYLIPSFALCLQNFLFTLHSLFTHSSLTLHSLTLHSLTLHSLLAHFSH
jgi:hypothetical protein